MRKLFFVIIQPTPTKFGGHIWWWSAINAISLGFCNSHSCYTTFKLQAESHRWFTNRWPTPPLFVPTFLRECSTDPNNYYNIRLTAFFPGKPG